jgi:hypothetical protein
LKVWTKGPVADIDRILLFCVALVVPPPQAVRMKARIRSSERMDVPTLALADDGNNGDRKLGVKATS